VSKQLGAHLGRTIMAEDLVKLLAACGTSATLDDYRKAVIEDNVLLKKSSGARDETFKRLKQLYGLDGSSLIFAVLRELWGQTTTGHALLSLLCAMARDPILRSTVELILETPEGTPLAAKDFEKVIAEKFPGRLSPKTLASVGRNLASSWTQAGYFVDGKTKSRKQVAPDATVMAYALFLAYLSGERGNLLFDSLWLKILDTSNHQLHNLAQQASQKGWLEYRHAGQVTEITFRHFMEKA
jgi:hypothetical protein